MDASDCREYAKRCIEMANTAPDRAQSALFELAAAWNRLASELDRDKGFQDRVKDLDVFGGVAGDESG